MKADRDPEIDNGTVEKKWEYTKEEEEMIIQFYFPVRILARETEFRLKWQQGTTVNCVPNDTGISNVLLGIRTWAVV